MASALSSLPPAEKKSIESVLTQKKEEVKLLSKITIVSQDKKKKPEDKTLILGFNRIFFFKSPNGKLDEDYHLLDCVEISSPSENEVSIKFKNQNIVKFTSTETDDILKTLYTNFVTNFPGITIGKALIFSVTPESRLVSIFQTASQIKELGGCGSFNLTYKSICDLLNIQPLTSVLWDMDNLYPFNNVKEFNLNEVFTYGPNDLKALLMSLSYNTYFNSFVATGCKLSNDEVNQLAESLKLNSTIQKLQLGNIQASKESIMSLLASIAENKSIKLNTINLTNNILENKALVSLGTTIQSSTSGLTYLNISDTSSGSKGLETLFNNILSSSSISTLTYFAMSNNKLEQVGTAALSKFLTKSTALTTLIMSGTMPVYSQLKSGCPSLEVIDFSGNRPTTTKEGILELLQFFKQMPKLNTVNLAKMGLSGEDIKNLFSPATNLIKAANVDLSDNELGDDGILKLCEVMYPNSSLRHLAIDNNFKSIKTKQRARAIEAICNLIEDNNSIESLSIAGGKLKNDLVPFILSLLKNQSLIKLDISGNSIGDSGALALVKVIWKNETLRTIKIDGNDFTFNAYKMLKSSIKRNGKSINMLPLPLADINSMLATDKTAGGSDKIHKSLADLQTSIQHNVPIKLVADSAANDSKPSPVRKTTAAPQPQQQLKPSAGVNTLPVKRPIRGPLYPGRTNTTTGAADATKGSSGGSVKGGNPIPPLVARSCDYLMAKGTKSVGIFRTCASAVTLKKIKARFEAGEDVDLAAECVDYDTVAGVLKSYFRELPVPIFPENLHIKFFQSAQQEGIEGKCKAYRDVIGSLGEIEKAMVKKLFLLLHLISLEKAENMMSPENIAICWAPTLFRSFASELLPINAYLMIHYYEIFDPENAPKRSSVGPLKGSGGIHKSPSTSRPNSVGPNSPVNNGVGNGSASPGNVRLSSGNIGGSLKVVGNVNNTGTRLSGSATVSPVSSELVANLSSGDLTDDGSLSPPDSPVIDGHATLKRRISRVSRISYSPVLPRAAWGESSRTLSSLFQDDLTDSSSDT